MSVRDNVVEAIGHTPLIKLERASAATGCTILGKAEFMNPGGSVKDRPGRQMILEAEKRGELKPGGLVVEGTAGNTGIGLAIVASARGYRTLIVIPNTQSQEKKDMLRLCGARADRGAGAALLQPEQLPAHCAAASRPASQDREERRAVRRPVEQPRQPPRALRSPPARKSGSETNGKVDGFICAVGTGGTLAGVSIYLREKKKDIVIGCADPRGAAMYNLFTTGQAKSTEGGSITEGIGLGRVTPIIDDIKVDKAYLIPDEEAVPMIFDLLEHEGLCLGGSSGINVAGAIRLAKELGPGHTIVTRAGRLAARAISPSCSTRNSCARRSCRCRPGMERKSSVEIPFEKA